PEIRFRLPWSMHDEAQLRALLAGARFEAMRMEKKRLPIDGVSARTIATGQTRGTPRGQLLEKLGLSLDDIIDRVTARLEKLGGGENFSSHGQAIYVEARAV
ncbi:MAG: hypothetical protein H7Y14_02185, partial [Burkholderiales bacterium]|nr:hypothetical protein [Burkholderiales bacterium]